MGWAYQIAMKILVKLGEIFGATHLIPISSAHISGVSYKTVGEPLIKFLEDIVEKGGSVKVTSTLNPSSIDPKHLNSMGLPEDLKDKQIHIVKLYERIGIKPTLTCTPYYIQRPYVGSHLAWAESSAVVYANSILRAWTNREGGPSALASALIGKTPNYGMHIPENRRASISIDIDCEIKGEVEFGALGIYVGRILGDEIPYFKGLRTSEEVELKHLGAALASTGMTPIFHLGTEPEYKGSLEQISIDSSVISRTIEDLSTSSERPNMVFIGCPHCSSREIERVAEFLDGRKVSKDVRLWVCTSRHVKNKAKTYVERIEASGGTVLSGMCPVVTWLKEMGIETVMTNSAKAAYYIPALNKVGVKLASTRECIEAACNPKG